MSIFHWFNIVLNAIGERAREPLPFSFLFFYIRPLIFPRSPSPIPLILSLSLSLSLLFWSSLSVSLSLSLSLSYLFIEVKKASRACVKELANKQEILEEVDSSNHHRVVLTLYEAISSRDVDTVHQILAPDLEWWFHGPPSHQFLMRLLTGAATSDDSDSDSFLFVPLSITSFESTVLVEGCDRHRSISWVHAWTVTDGIITQVREYFNTSLTVSRFNSPKQQQQSSPSVFSRSSSASTSSIKSTSSSSLLHCPSIWESSFSNQAGKSVPGLVLAI